MLAERDSTIRELERLASFPELNPNPLVEVTREGKITYLNPAARRVFPELEGEGNMSSHPLLLALNSVAVELGRDGRSAVIRELAVNGVPYQQEVTFHAETGVLRFHSIDVTPYRTAEEDLRQSQKLRAIGQLAGGISHDFNNILASMEMNIDLLLDAMKDEDPLREYVEEIRSSAHRAASLTRQLLAFSRKQVLQPRTIDLNQLVANLEKMLRRLIGEPIELRAKLAANPLPIRADPSQMEQVILNLVINARDAMPKGGLLTISTERLELDEGGALALPGLQPGPHAILELKDTGQGMSTNTLAHLFEPFFTTKEVGRGTGLGLSTVYGIVKQSGGEVRADSEIGKGSTFTVFLPLTNHPFESAEWRRPERSEQAGTETILVAEDEAALRESICKLLRMRGYRVLEAADGDEGVNVSESFGETIHLLVTDIVMPKLGGRDLAEQVQTSRPGIKVLYISGYADDALALYGVLDEGHQYLEKPFDAHTLALRVRALLDGKPV